MIIGLHDNFAPWVGTLVKDLAQPILFIADEGREEEVVTRLSRVGYDNAIGCLEGGLPTWKEAGYDTDFVQEISADEFAAVYYASPDTLKILDARKKSEYDAEHTLHAINFPLEFVNQHMNELKKDQRYYIHCAGGYRSVILISILKSRGFSDLINIRSGFKAMQTTRLKSMLVGANL